MRQNISHYWNSEAFRWDNLYRKLSPTTIFLKARQKALTPIIKKFRNKKILDVGCGNGVFMAEVIKNNGFVVGLDYSADMLAIARKTLQKFPADSYQLINGSAINLPFSRNSFDAILASGLTDYLSKKETEKFLSEASRVLKKNGIIVVTFPKQNSPFSFLRSGSGLFLRDKILSLPPILSSFTTAEIEKIMRETGFSINDWYTVLGTMFIVVGEKI